MGREDISIVRPLQRTRRLIAVAGGKGGVGKSTVAVNLAIAYAGRGAKVLLVDTDLGMADLSLLLGVAPVVGVREFFEGAPIDALLSSAHGVHLLPGVNGSYALANLGAAPRRRLLAAISGLGARFDTIIMDSAPGLSENSVAFAGAAAEVVLVTQTSPTALADAYAYMKALARRHSLRRAFVLVNAVRSISEAEEAGGRLAALAERFLSVELLALPCVPNDPEIDAYAAEGIPFLLRRPDTPAGRAFQHIARRIDALSASAAPRTPQQIQTGAAAPQEESAS
jgi:flagellar biosynthesis protein FlhG